MDGTALPPNAELEQQMGGPFLIQQFIPEIQSDGEISLVYIDGQFSHAVLKRPRAGDFRVQQEHGGSPKRSFHRPRKSIRQTRLPRWCLRYAIRSIAESMLWRETASCC